jgi:hypothetical protein
MRFGLFIGLKSRFSEARPRDTFTIPAYWFGYTKPSFPTKVPNNTRKAPQTPKPK